MFTSDHVVISGAYFGFSSESLVIVSDPVGNSNACTARAPVDDAPRTSRFLSCVACALVVL